MKLRCFQCFGPFGLTRHHHHCHAFCSQRCLDSYKLGRPKADEKPPDELVALLRYPP
jgi:hypothetical protein